MTLRRLRAQPGFTLVAVLSLAIGIGATTAVLSVTRAALFEGLPYPDADRLVLVWQRHTALGAERSLLAGPDVARLQASSRSLDGLAFVQRPRDAALGGVGPPEPVRVARVSDTLFSVLQVSPARGSVRLPAQRADGGATPGAAPPGSTRSWCSDRDSGSQPDQVQ